MTHTSTPYEAATEQARTVLDASAGLELDRLSRPGLAMLVGQLQQALRQLLDSPPVLFEARWDNELIGRYATREAAREACVTDARRAGPDQLGPDTVPTWRTDQDGTEDLLTWEVPPGAQDPAAGPDPTGYTVTPITVTPDEEVPTDG